MPLNYDTTTIQNFDKLDPNLTNILISLTMSVRMGEITKNNWKEFYRRIMVLERLHGNFSVKDCDKPFYENYIQPKDIQDRIGLKTNSGELTQGQFDKTLRVATTHMARENIERMISEDYMEDYDERLSQDDLDYEADTYC